MADDMKRSDDTNEVDLMQDLPDDQSADLQKTLSDSDKDEAAQ